MHREQHVFGENERDRHHARLALVLFQQKIRAQVQIAVIGFVVTRGSFDVFDLVFIR